MDLVLIRHGQSTNNLLWQRTGSSRGRSADSPLTPLGRQQATALAEAFARKEFGAGPSHVFTSLMTRAVQTAAPLAEVLDLPLIGHEHLFEINGPVEIDHDTDRRRPHPGASRSALERLSPRLQLPESATDHGWWRGPVEDEAGCRLRAHRVVRDLVARFGSTDAAVVLVSHATFGQYVIRSLLGIETMTGWIRIDNTAVSHFTDVAGAAAEGAGPTVATWINRTTHLHPDQVTQ